MRFVLCLMVVALALGGCSGLRSALGVDRTAPDEFNIVARAPLAMPPDYSLRPPEPGLGRPQDLTPRQQARQTVFRAGEQQQAALATPRGGRSEGELAFLRQAGAGEADPSIRALVNEENSRLVEAERSFVDRLVFWRESEPAGTVVDARREQQRLRENLALGKPPAEGEMPTIERKRRALLEGIF
jgi:Protein of unknown function (DUF3035)